MQDDALAAEGYEQIISWATDKDYNHGISN